MNAQVHEPTGIVRPQARSAVTEIEQSRAVAEVTAHMQVARRYPRDEIVARDKILNAFTSPTLAAIAKYSYARGGTEIEGPSIHSLRTIARHWGNISTGVEEIARGQGQSECRAYAIDLETGFKDEKKFVVRHIRDKKGGGVALTDERDIYELVANQGARRQRACLEACIPRDVVEEAMSQVDTTLAADFEITTEYLGTLVGAFEKFGVTKPMIEAFIQRHIEAITPAQAARLKKIHISLRDGVGKPEDWFDKEAGKAPDGSAPQPAAQTGTAGVKERAKRARAAQQEAEAAAQGEGVTLNSGDSKIAAGGPEPIIDEAAALLAMDRAKDEGEASAVIDRCAGQLFRPRVVEAFNARFATQA